MRIRKEQSSPNDDDVRLVSSCSDAFAHPLRVQFFQYIYSENLQRKRVCNKDLVQHFGCAQATASQHMNKLTASGLVKTESEATKTFYYVQIGLLGSYLNALRRLHKPPVQAAPQKKEEKEKEESHA